MGRSAARLGDGVSHGVIVSGSSSVLIGDQGAIACSVCPGGLQVGAPVNPQLGAKVLVGEEEQDFALPGALSLIWQRHYSSYVNAEQGGACGLFGYGWKSALEIYLHLDTNGVSLFDSAGRILWHFTPGEAGYWRLVTRRDLIGREQKILYAEDLPPEQRTLPLKWQQQRKPADRGAAPAH